MDSEDQTAFNLRHTYVVANYNTPYDLYTDEE